MLRLTFLDRGILLFTLAGTVHLQRWTSHPLCCWMVSHVRHSTIMATYIHPGVLFYVRCCQFSWYGAGKAMSTHSTVSTKMFMVVYQASGMASWNNAWKQDAWKTERHLLIVQLATWAKPTPLYSRMGGREAGCAVATWNSSVREKCRISDWWLSSREFAFIHELLRGAQS